MRGVITAGGRIGDAYAQAAGTDVKALVEVRGVTMLDAAIDALRGAGAAEIAVVGGDAVRAACGARVERVIEAAESGTANLVKALRAWPDDGRPLLYATSDMPYVRAEHVAEFVARVPPGNVALPLAEHAAFVQRFPDAPPAGIVLGGARVVNGDVFYIPAGSFAAVEEVAQRFFDARKNPWQMARLVSARIALRYLFKRLSIAHVEGHAARVLGVPTTAVRGCAPELAFDADTFADYEYVRAHA